MGCEDCRLRATIRRLCLYAGIVIMCAGLAGCGATRIFSSPSNPPAQGGSSAKGKGGTYKPYTVMGQTYYPLGSADGYAENGVASWYGPGFHGRLTANGERFNMHALTAAHTRLPLGTRVRVTHLGTGASLIVRINDRGPFVKDRVIDLSHEAARRLGVIRKGSARVRLEAL